MPDAPKARPSGAGCLAPGSLVLQGLGCPGLGRTLGGSVKAGIPG